MSHRSRRKRFTKFQSSKCVSLIWLLIGLICGIVSSYVLIVFRLEIFCNSDFHGLPDLKQLQLQKQQQLEEGEERSLDFVIAAVHVGDTAPLSFILSRNDWWREEQKTRRVRIGKLSGRKGDGGGPLPAPPPDPPTPRPLFDHVVMHFVDSSLYREKKPLWSSERAVDKDEAKSYVTDDMAMVVVVPVHGLAGSSANEGFAKALQLLVEKGSGGHNVSEHDYIFVTGDVLLDETKLCHLVKYVQLRGLSETKKGSDGMNKKKFNKEEELVINGDSGRVGGRSGSHSSKMTTLWEGGENCSRHHRSRLGTNVEDNGCEFVEGIVVTLETLKTYRRRHTESNCSSSGSSIGCDTMRSNARFTDTDGGDGRKLPRAAMTSQFYLDDVSYVQCFFYSKVNSRREIGHTCQWKESLGNRQIEILKMTDVISSHIPQPAFQELYLYFKEQQVRDLKARSSYLYSEVSASSKIISLLSHGKSISYDYRIHFDNWSRNWRAATASNKFLDEETHWKNTNDRLIYTTHNIHKSPAQKLFIKGSLRLLEDSLNSLFHELNFMSPFLESAKFHHSYQYLSPLFGVWHFVNIVASISDSGTNVSTSMNSSSSSRSMVVAADKKLTSLMFLTAEKFQQVQTIEFPNWSDRKMLLWSLNDEHVSIIVPVAGRSDSFRRFFTMLRSVLDNDTNLSFIFIIFAEKQTNDKLILIQLLQYEYPHVSFQSVHRKTTFSRAEALQIGVGFVEHDDVILLFMDVDMVFTGSFLNRVRRFTVRHRQAYFPIYFSQYKSANECSPDKVMHCSPFRFQPDDGFWRYFGYGMVSIYKSDFIEVGGYDLKIKGWGLEDVKLYEACLTGKIDVFRAPDLGLVHIYHSKNCSPTLAPKQYGMCQETKFNIYLNQHTLAKLVYREQDILYRLLHWK